MKKIFTKLFSAAILMFLISTGIKADAQTTDSAKMSTPKADADTTWKPQRRVWGYSFGDFYYDGHSPATTVPQGKENNYYQVPTYRNAFQFRRLYLGYDYEITKRFKAEVLLASEPTANTGNIATTTTTTVIGSPGVTATSTSTTAVSNSDNLLDNKMSFFIKNFNLRYRDLWNGTDFVIGEMSTPGFALNEPGTNGPTGLSETTWGYRSVERTITDFHKNNSYDVGASLQGTFDPATKNFGYVLMVANNTQANLLSASNANTGFYKIFYGDIWAEFLNKKLHIDFYADYAKTAPGTATIPGQEHNMYKIFVSYKTKPVTLGVEAYTQKIANGVTSSDGTTKTPSDATVHGLSVFAKGAINKTLNYFARFDAYNPNTDFINTDSYAVNTNYGSYDPYTKEKFVTAGIDWNPTKNVHFMPNVWFTQYTDQNATSVTAYVPDNHTIVYRMTFFFTFGK